MEVGNTTACGIVDEGGHFRTGNQADDVPVMQLAAYIYEVCCITYLSCFDPSAIDRAVKIARKVNHVSDWSLLQSETGS